jgi:hypothetical protein
MADVAAERNAQAQHAKAHRPTHPGGSLTFPVAVMQSALRCFHAVPKHVLQKDMHSQNKGVTWCTSHFVLAGSDGST